MEIEHRTIRVPHIAAGARAVDALGVPADATAVQVWRAARAAGIEFEVRDAQRVAWYRRGVIVR